jgi:hypothetical protein
VISWLKEVLKQVIQLFRATFHRGRIVDSAIVGIVGGIQKKLQAQDTPSLSLSLSFYTTEWRTAIVNIIQKAKDGKATSFPVS